MRILKRETSRVNVQPDAWGGALVRRLIESVVAGRQHPALLYARSLLTRLAIGVQQ